MTNPNILENSFYRISRMFFCYDMRNLYFFGTFIVSASRNNIFFFKPDDYRLRCFIFHHRHISPFHCSWISACPCSSKISETATSRTATVSPFTSPVLTTPVIRTQEPSSGSPGLSGIFAHRIHLYSPLWPKPF